MSKAKGKVTVWGGDGDATHGKIWIFSGINQWLLGEENIDLHFKLANPSCHIFYCEIVVVHVPQMCQTNQQSQKTINQ